MRDVSYTYGEGTNREFGALTGINLNISKGEFVAIIGHNGSGKSTLAKHLNALLIPTAGDVIVKGMNTRDENLLWEIRQAVGMVFQNPDNQIVATTVEEDVAFGPENLGLAPEEIRRRVDEALRIVGMDKLKQNAPHLLSGGQKQRVAIAGVIAMRPECIVLDEPTAMLDPSGRQEVMHTIRRLNKEEGITVVHITHFMEEAVAADRIVVMENGGIAFEGKPAQVFARTEDLERLDLDVPQVVQLASELRKAGVIVPEEALTVEDMVECLCRLP